LNEIELSSARTSPWQRYPDGSTAQQFRQPLAAAGLRLGRIVETATLQIIEASAAS
jgi:hypothetical protein